MIWSQKLTSRFLEARKEGRKAGREGGGWMDGCSGHFTTPSNGKHRATHFRRENPLEARTCTQGNQFLTNPRGTWRGLKILDRLHLRYIVKKERKSLSSHPHPFSNRPLPLLNPLTLPQKLAPRALRSNLLDLHAPGPPLAAPPGHPVRDVRREAGWGVDEGLVAEVGVCGGVDVGCC
jgi:hypothetical protein